MKNKHEDQLILDGISVSEKIDQIIGRYVASDPFSEKNREALINDLKNDYIINHTPAIVAIIEYSTRSYVYITTNVFDDLAISIEEIMSQGLARALMNFEKGHRKIYLENFLPSIFDTYAKYAPMNEAKDIHVSYTTLLHTYTGALEWYHHQLSVLSCDENGMPLYAMKYLSNIHGLKKDDTLTFTVHKKSKDHPLQLLISKEYPGYELSDLYSPREKEILELVTAGLSTREIAEKLYLSEYTVSTHRKNIAKKSKNG